jgi:hypothetical protein
MPVPKTGQNITQEPLDLHEVDQDIRRIELRSGERGLDAPLMAMHGFQRTIVHSKLMGRRKERFNGHMVTGHGRDSTTSPCLDAPPSSYFRLPISISEQTPLGFPFSSRKSQIL